jgi:Domain of unknown function (DUF4279)
MHKYTVQLRIYSDSLDPADITRALGVQPFLIQKKGDISVRGEAWNESVWAYAGPLDSQNKVREWDDIEEGVLHVTSTIANRSKMLKKIAKLHKAIWWCGHFQSSFDGGPLFSVEFLKLLSSYEIPMFIDNYFECLADP